MSEKKSTRAGQGTFAKLYDVHEEMSKRNSKPLGRPRKKVQRKPTTVHLTQSEIRNLSHLHLSINEQISANRSELVGVAIDVLALVMKEKDGVVTNGVEFKSLEDFRQRLFDFIKS